MRRPLPSRRILSIAALLAIMIAIFAVDTVTDYAVAVAVFYTAVILAAVRLLTARAVIGLACICIGLTVLSFCLTPFGSYRVGLVNSGISILAIAITTYLALKMVAAKAAAHEAQTQLLRMARVMSLGELSTSIAHEVNQPLAAIVTSANACQRWLAQEPPNLDKARQATARILSDAGRASDVIARIRSLTKGDMPHKSRFDLNQAILEVLSLSRSEMDRNGISLGMDLGDGLPWVFADQVQIQQVIVNLVLNAMEAMAATGDKARYVKISSFKDMSGMPIFSIADSGVGLAPAAFNHLFDALWTTKKNGMGLGLTISRTIIEANGGRIWAQPNPSGGAMLQFSLPTVGVP